LICSRAEKTFEERRAEVEDEEEADAEGDEKNGGKPGGTSKLNEG
jgi:hypothetical protein